MKQFFYSLLTKLGIKKKKEPINHDYYPLVRKSIETIIFLENTSQQETALSFARIAIEKDIDNIIYEDKNTDNIEIEKIYMKKCMYDSMVVLSNIILNCIENKNRTESVQVVNTRTGEKLKKLILHYA